MTDQLKPYKRETDYGHVGDPPQKRPRTRSALAADYTINPFYVLGAAMWDSGWFAHLVSNGLQTFSA